MELFLTIAITHFLALLAPGPDFFLILKTLMQGRKSAAKSVCIGIALGNTIILVVIYSCLFLMGKVDATIFLYLKWIGALYLSYLAYQCFSAARLSMPKISNLDQVDIIQHKTSLWKNFIQGLCSSILNPKNLMFYSTLILLIYSEYNVFQNVLVSVWMVALVLLWNLSIVQLLSLKFYLQWLNQHIRHLYFLAGICFLMFSILLFVTQ